MPRQLKISKKEFNAYLRQVKNKARELEDDKVLNPEKIAEKIKQLDAQFCYLVSEINKIKLIINQNADNGDIKIKRIRQNNQTNRKNFKLFL